MVSCYFRGHRGMSAMERKPVIYLLDEPCLIKTQAESFREDLGAEVTCLSLVAELLEACRRRKPDFIVAELAIPYGTKDACIELDKITDPHEIFGTLRALRKLHDEKRLEGVTVVIMHTNSFPVGKYLKQLVDLGVVQHIFEKPFDDFELLKCMCGHLGIEYPYAALMT